MRRRTLIAAPLAAPFVLAAAGTRAADWPTRPLKLVVTFPPGGSSDLVARLVAPGLSERLRQPVVVENRPGAGGTIAASAVANATDQHTLLVANAAPISISPFILPTLPYDPVRAFAHIAFIGAVANVIVVHPSAPATDWPSFLAWLKRDGDKVGVGSNGIGSVSHVVLEMLNKTQGTSATHVPYRGSAPMMTDLLGGSIKVAIDSLPQNVDPIRLGQVRGILMTSATRNARAPNVPAAGELGLADLVAENWIGLSGPSSLPAEGQARLAAAMAEVMATQAVKARMDEWGFSTEPMSPPAFQGFIARQAETWGPVIKASGATLN